MTVLRNLVCLVFLATSVNGQESSDLVVPTNRYIRENADLMTLTHWPDGIAFEAVGDVPAELGFHSASMLKFLGEHAKTQISLPGSPGNWFLPKGSIGPETNYALLFGRLKDDKARNATKVYIGRDIDIDISNAKPEIRRLLSSGLSVQGAGCFAAWGANEKNEVRGFVLVVDTEVSQLDQRACIDRFVPSSLGVLPVFSNLSWSEYEGKRIPQDEPFVDESELVFLLRASAYCRDVLEDFSLQCPAAILGDVYRHHESTLSNSETVK